MMSNSPRWGTAAGVAVALVLACMPEPTRKRSLPPENLDANATPAGGGGRGGSAAGGAGGAGGSSTGMGGSGGGGGGGTAGRGGGGGAAGAGGDAGVDAPVDARPVDARPVDARPVDAGVDGRTVDAGPAPTFTQLYAEYFGKPGSTTVIGCQGTACHNVNREGFICSTKANCYDSISIRADGCEPEECIITEILASKTMPKGSTFKKFSTADLDRLKAWIAAGAKNN